MDRNFLQSYLVYTSNKSCHYHNFQSFIIRFYWRIKYVSEDFELLFKKFQIYIFSCSFNIKQPYLESSQSFDELLLIILKSMNDIQQYSTQSIQKVNYTGFQYHFNGSIKNYQNIEFINILVLFYYNKNMFLSQNFKIY
ncbi:unnamed protein product [Paramecium pentaurelia]|uniref:Uncharacterized protein n=1 Tax=Paramecium pentaurelia TaxID=43138 RepID=A0A8S1TTQ5_9CILI|nr:unnamed protein product [Paramecium pentaurelia]